MPSATRYLGKPWSRRHALEAVGLTACAAALAACGAAPVPTPTAITAPASAPAPAAPAKTEAPKPAAASTEAPKPAAAPTEAPKPAAPVAGKPATTLKLWYLGYLTPEFWRKLYAEFEAKNPAIKIEELSIPYSDHEQKVLTALASGQVPDVLPTHPVSNATLASKNALVSIDDYLAKSPVGVKDFFAGAIEYFKYKGKYWSLSYYSGPWLMYYNRKLVQEAGLKDPGELYAQKQWTREKLGEYAAAIAKGSGQDKVFGLDFTNPQLDVMCMYIWGDGGEIWNTDVTQTLINSDAGVKAYSFTADLVKKGVAPNRGDVAAFAQVPGGLFGSNKVGLGHRFRGAVSTWDAAPVAPNLGVVPIPAHPNGQFYSVDGPNGIGISPKSSLKDESWQAIFFSVTRGNELMMEGGWSAPVTRALAESQAWRKGMRPWESVDVYNFASANVKALYMPPGFVEITKLINSAYDQMIGGSATVKAALDEVKPKVDAVLKEQGG